MSNRPWVSHYTPGTRPDITPIPFRTIADMVRRQSAASGSATAFTQCMPNGMAGSLTFAQVDRLSDEFAAYLRGGLKLKAGDRVAIQMPNSLAYPVVLFGVMKAGCVAVNTNPLYTPPEMIHQFSDSGARVLVISDLFADRLPAVLPKTKIETVVTVRVTEWFATLQATLIRAVLKYAKKQLPPITVPHTPLQDALKTGRERLASGVDLAGYLDGVGLDSVAALQYTGGTTGVSKGAALSHRNLLTNVAQMLEMNGAYLKAGEDSIMTALPLYHIFAFTVNLLLFYQLGGHNILIPSPRPPSNLRKPFEKYRITWFSGVNTLFNALANEDWFIKNPPKLKLSVAGGMALHGSVAKRWEQVVGTPVVEGYGLTEASPVVSFNPVQAVKVGSIGIPLPSTLVRCVDEAGADVPNGTPGELLVKGDQVMVGYWERPEESAKVLRDGWLYTGDVAEMDDDGYVKIVDRKKDMILVSGFNVYPNEVEEVIAAHPGVREAAVIGVPDEHSGEAVKAFVVKKDPSLTAEALTAHCRSSLAGYKVPRQVEFRDDLPKSPIGKIIRKDLRVAAPAAGVPA
ncbi:AMP-binding protein [Longimicrobium terrae]|uniref:Long-chain-fatty-acid--CoA ligase n=1 Tax=Longimicrobium terrae TaxID=1639882 RepID=A0A841GUW5_9BACT|nr:AMP-binding protein [Longimicrobium terrae]MBB4634187.1 long-chain acyl-CoA synthetase [Longimicrobium terrae]MBB6068923.1 long-chain acyl-CoA synthetase [Longimicrobium terrae]NNC28103.1 AMP-binding protein [Longimicrobium terrae]